MIPFNDAIYDLTTTRASRLTVALAPQYGADSDYATNPVFAMFRDDLPTEVEMEKFTAATMLSYFDYPEARDAPMVTAIAGAYTDYGYHCITHAFLAAIIADRLAEKYMPLHQEARRLVVLAALLHDAYHSHGRTPDSENIARTKVFIENLIAVHGTRLGLPSNAAPRICSMIGLTEYNGAGFDFPLPEIEAVPLAEDAPAYMVQRMSCRILGEADLMMSATPYWPKFAAVLAQDAATSNQVYKYLDLRTFCATQAEFIVTGMMQRCTLPETRAALSEVLAIHSHVMDSTEA